jgi:hypothetical protein
MALMFRFVMYFVACRAVCRQRLSKPFSAVTDTHATIKVLLETVFYTRYNRFTLFLGDVNTGTWPSSLGES